MKVLIVAHKNPGNYDSGVFLIMCLGRCPHALFTYHTLTAVRLSNGAFSGDSLKPRASGTHWGGGADRLASVNAI